MDINNGLNNRRGTAANEHNYNANVTNSTSIMVNRPTPPPSNNDDNNNNNNSSNSNKFHWPRDKFKRQQHMCLIIEYLIYNKIFLQSSKKNYSKEVRVKCANFYNRYIKSEVKNDFEEEMREEGQSESQFADTENIPGISERYIYDFIQKSLELGEQIFRRQSQKKQQKISTSVNNNTDNNNNNNNNNNGDTVTLDPYEEICLQLYNEKNKVLHAATVSNNMVFTNENVNTTATSTMKPTYTNSSIGSLKTKNNRKRPRTQQEKGHITLSRISNTNNNNNKLHKTMSNENIDDELIKETEKSYHTYNNHIGSTENNINPGDLEQQFQNYNFEARLNEDLNDASASTGNINIFETTKNHMIIEKLRNDIQSLGGSENFLENLKLYGSREKIEANIKEVERINEQIILELDKIKQDLDTLGNNEDDASTDA